MPESQPTEQAIPRDTAESEASRQAVAGLLRRYRSEIHDAWVLAVQSHSITKRAAGPVLLDLSPDLLDRIATSLDRSSPPISVVLGITRPEGGFALAQIVLECQLLREAISDVLERIFGESVPKGALEAIDHVLDRAVTHLVQQFAQKTHEVHAYTADTLRLLADASVTLASSLNYDETLERVAQLVVPMLADWCVVDLVDEATGELRRVSVAHRDPALSAVAREWARSYPTNWEATRGLAEVLRSGEPELVADVSDQSLIDAAGDNADLEALRALGLKSYLIVPLIARHRTIGAITLVSASSGRRYGPPDVELARELARRAALAVDNARSYDHAQQAIRAREQILATVSHDLRNPLSAVSLIISSLRSSATDPDTAQQLELVLSAVEQMKRLINDMFDTAALQSGRLALVWKDVNASQLVVDAINRHHALAAQKDVALVDEIEAPTMFRCDPDRIAQVLDNLVGNAIKFCSPGDRVHVRACGQAGEVRFDVADTGPGIDAHDLPHIFEPYWTSPTASRRGTGLGLYISKGIIEAHGGRIWAESVRGQGTRIAFTLPVAARG